MPRKYGSSGVEQTLAEGKAPPLCQPPSAEGVFHQYAAGVYSLARHMMGHDADAEDVTQDVMVQVVRKLNSFRGEADLATWLHRVTVNAVLMHRAKQARRRKRQVDVALATVSAGAPFCGPGVSREAPEQAVLGQERKKMVEQAIAGLPELYRDVFVLSEVERLSNAGISDLLGVSLSAVKSRLHRARLMMREALASYF
jgi:RNA polymerase sigma-70 factor (ECF subfamily)